MPTLPRMLRCVLRRSGDCMPAAAAKKLRPLFTPAANEWQRAVARWRTRHAVAGGPSQRGLRLQVVSCAAVDTAEAAYSQQGRFSIRVSIMLGAAGLCCAETGRTAQAQEANAISHMPKPQDACLQSHVCMGWIWHAVHAVDGRSTPWCGRVHTIAGGRRTVVSAAWRSRDTASVAGLSETGFALVEGCWIWYAVGGLCQGAIVAHMRHAGSSPTRYVWRSNEAAQ